MARVEISVINPVYWREINPTQAAQYNSKHIDSFLHLATLHPWQYPRGVLQPWQLNDSIRQQLISEVGPVLMRLRKTEGGTIDVPFTQKQEDRYSPGRFIYESIFAASNLTPGIYKPVLMINGVETHEAECWHVAELHPETLLAEYDNPETYQNFRFTANGLKPSLRFWGSFIPSDEFGSTDAIYTDEEEDTELLNSVPFDVHKLFINGPEGTPKSFAKRLFRIFGCQDLMLDGRYYVKANEGGKMEKIESEAGRVYPLEGWSIQLRDRINHDSFISENDVQQTRRIAVAYNVDEKGFSADSSSGHIGTIHNYE